MIKKLGIGCGGLFLLFVLIGIATGGSQPTSTGSTSAPGQTQAPPVTPPAAAATVVPPAAATPPPAAYEVVSRREVNAPGRTRTVVNVAISAETSMEQRIATLAEAARKERKPHVVAVYAWRTRAEADRGAYTIGVATVSTDRMGWDGAGQPVLGGRDNGSIVVWTRANCSATATVETCAFSGTDIRTELQP